MKKKKIVFIISGVDYAYGFQWLEAYMDKNKYDVSFIFLHPSEPILHKQFIDNCVNSYFIKLNSKLDFPKVFVKLYSYFLKNKPQIVHAHLFDACLLALPAAKMAGIKKRIYTRHHSTYHFDYHPHMVKYDKFINSLCTQIAAISINVKEVLIKKEHVNPDKVFLVNHGFEIEKFEFPQKENVDKLMNLYNTTNKHPVIGVISRFTEWKGIQYIIPAFKRILEQYPNALLILANAKGDMKDLLLSQLKQLPSNSYVTIEFEKDLFSLYKLFDVYVHVPIDSRSEAFGQTYVEALAAGIPSVFTLSGIANEFIVDKRNALVVPFKNADEIYRSIIELLDNMNLRDQLIVQGRNDVKKLFPINVMMNALYKIYEA